MPFCASPGGRAVVCDSDIQRGQMTCPGSCRESVAPKPIAPVCCFSIPLPAPYSESVPIFPHLSTWSLAICEGGWFEKLHLDISTSSTQTMAASSRKAPRTPAVPSSLPMSAASMCSCASPGGGAVLCGSDKGKALLTAW